MFLLKTGGKKRMHRMLVVAFVVAVLALATRLVAAIPPVICRRRPVMANVLKMALIESILSLHAQRWSQRRIS